MGPAHGFAGALDRADVFALGASGYELARGAPLPKEGAEYAALRQGKLTLLPGVSAAIITLALTVAGHKAGALYDGSWAEWGKPDGPPIETGA